LLATESTAHARTSIPPTWNDPPFVSSTIYRIDPTYNKLNINGRLILTNENEDPILICQIPLDKHHQLDRLLRFKVGDIPCRLSEGRRKKGNRVIENQY
jgi:hypothetical protein